MWSSKDRERQEGAWSLSSKTIFVTGPRGLQNELLASFLEQETGANCETAKGLIDVAPTEDRGETDNPSRMIMWDFLGTNLQNFLLEVEANNEKISSQDLFVLFNVCPGLGIEQKLLLAGVRGFFYENDPMEYFKRGVYALFRGELWLSRGIMSECIVKGYRRVFLPRAEQQTMLTPREMEILTAIATGSTNGQIADRLCISRHTVKTHLYNIFKKINVPSRLQAALWATKNLL